MFLLGVNALLLSSVFWMARPLLCVIYLLTCGALQDGHDNTGAAARQILGFIVFTIALSMFTSFQALPICALCRYHLCCAVPIALWLCLHGVCYLTHPQFWTRRTSIGESEAADTTLLGAMSHMR